MKPPKLPRKAAMLRYDVLCIAYRNESAMYQGQQTLRPLVQVNTVSEHTKYVLHNRAYVEHHRAYAERKYLALY